jgi:hypothetical protein
MSARTFHRSAGSRAVSSACALLFVGAAVSTGATVGVTRAFFILAGLALLSLASLLGAWADRYTVGEEGIEYRNVLLARLGARPRLTPWSDVVAVREHRGLRFGRLEPHASALFLALRSGRRLVLDSLADFEAVRGAVQHHCAAARGEP